MIVISISQFQIIKIIIAQPYLLHSRKQSDFLFQTVSIILLYLTYNLIFSNIFQLPIFSGIEENVIHSLVIGCCNTN